MKINLHLVFVITLLVFLVKFILSSAYSYHYLHQLKTQKDWALVSDAAHIQLALLNADSLAPPLFNRFEQNLTLLKEKLASNQTPSLELLASQTLPAATTAKTNKSLFLVESGNLSMAQGQILVESLATTGKAKFTAFYKNHHIYLTYTLYDPIDLSWLIATLGISAGLVLMIFGWWWIFIYYEKKLPGRIFAALIGDLTEENAADPLIQNLKHKIETYYHEKNMMLSALSHDIKTPLTEAMLTLELVESPEFLEVASSVRRNLEQIDAVVKSSLDYAKDSTHLEKVEVELVSFFEKILEIYRDKKAKAKLDVRFYCEEREIFAFIEIALMRRLLMNLIENAEKYASLVEIRLRRDVVKSRVILEVQDNGPGVPEQSLLKMGSPYYRVDQSRSRTTGGTGLGLAIVKKISALHGGKVEFENRLPELGGGLCVRVFINLKF